MKQNTEINTNTKDSTDEFNQLTHEFEGLPETVRIRPLRRSRYRIQGGLPMDELERVSVMRIWEALAGIPVDPRYPDDFEPPLPDQDLRGCVGE